MYIYTQNIVNIYKYIYLPQQGCSEVVGAGGEHTNTWDFNNAVVTMSRCKGKKLIKCIDN